MKILVTGATGFLGPYVVDHLRSSYDVSIVSLRNNDVDQLILEDVNAVVHLAGKAHDMKCTDDSEYFTVNRDLTLTIAKQAKEAGVEHFIFMSTVKVYGDHDVSNFNENSITEPTDPYGESKLEAEKGLKLIESNDFIVSIIRPPLIYGSGVKGNLQNLLGLCEKLPLLPFGNIINMRSFVYAGNVAALVTKLIELRLSGVFIANDGETKSTTDLVNEIVRSLNSVKMLVSIPGIMRFILKHLKPSLYTRLFGDYYVDFSHTNKSLGFNPPFTFSEGIAEMVSNYKNKE